MTGIIYLQCFNCKCRKLWDMLWLLQKTAVRLYSLSHCVFQSIHALFWSTILCMNEAIVSLNEWFCIYMYMHVNLPFLLQVHIKRKNKIAHYSFNYLVPNFQFSRFSWFFQCELYWSCILYIDLMAWLLVEYKWNVNVIAKKWCFHCKEFQVDINSHQKI